MTDLNSILNLPINATSPWDPFKHEATGEPQKSAIYRIKRDLMNIFKDPPPGILAFSDENDLTLIHGLIIGVLNTPYACGFFYFVLKCPNNYPLQPPKVKLMTTDGGKVRFNPNLYQNGKVCLSILGTWEGPGWSPAQQLSGVLISIQSLMGENPYFNEPGFSRERIPGDSENYNKIVRHETIRVAVCGMLENDSQIDIPAPFKDFMESSFLSFYDDYIDTVQSSLHLDDTIVHEPYTRNVFKFQYKRILERLQALHEKITKKFQSLQSAGDSDSNTSESELSADTSESKE